MEQLDWTGSFANHAPPVLLRPGISRKHRIEPPTHFESRLKGLIGSVQSVKEIRALFELGVCAVEVCVARASHVEGVFTII